MMRITMLAIGCTIISTLGNVQGEDLHRHNFTLGMGPGVPVGNTAKYLGSAPLVAVGYGYRFTPLFQADVGLQVAFGAANNQNAEVTDFGPVQGGDHEFMIPLGGRLIIPMHLKRLEMSAGGGGVYLHYSETIPQNSFVTGNCYSCTSRGGWGAYGLGNVSYFLDDNHNFHIGTTFQFISASTDGQAVGSVPAIRTTDHWMNVTVEFGLSF